MFFILRFSLYFTFSFLILSLPIQDGPLFNKIYDITSPVTQSIVSYVKNKVGHTTSELQEVGQRAFSNTSDIPKTIDKVSSELSSNVKEEIEKHDSYTVEEKESLLQVLKDSQ